MSIETLILYGSTARGEQQADSDLDLFGITNDDDHTMIVKSKANLALYPAAKVYEMARRGDLFLLHIVSEGRVIYDGAEHFSALQESFCYRESYGQEIVNATRLGWALLDVADSASNFALINKRMAWCARTVLIARAAELRAPVFSASSLAKFANSTTILHIVENKNSALHEKEIMDEFASFLTTFGLEMDARPRNLSLDEYIAQFKDDDNPVGEKTMKALLMTNAEYMY